MTKKNCYPIFCVAFCAVIFFYIYADLDYHTHFYNYLSNTQQVHQKKYFIILSTSLKARYMFLLPFSVASWNKLGIPAIIFLIGPQKDFESHPKARSTIKILQTMDVQIIFLESKRTSPVTMSQLVRLFPAAMPLSSLHNPDETIFITSDADIFVFILNNHIPQQNKTLHLYNSRCCPPTNIPAKRGKQKVRMYPITSIAASVTTWRNIMGFNSSDYTVDDIENYLFTEFGDNFFHFNDTWKKHLIGSPIWYADQSLISYKLDIWLKNPINNQSLSERREKPRRIDRARWPVESEFKTLKMKDWDDAHLPTDTFQTTDWNKFKPFLEFVFKGDTIFLEKLQKYRDEFVKN